MANPLIRKYPKRINTPQPNKSAGILDDFAVRKVVATKEGSITRTPVDDQIAQAVKAARALGGANDNFMMCFNESKVFTAVVEET